MSLVIRSAEPGDRHALELLLAALMREHQAAYPGAYPAFQPEVAAAYFAAGYAPRLGTDPSLVAVLAVDRAPVGLLVGEVVTRAVGRPATVGFVEWFYVLPEARGQGIGRAIIRAALALVRPLGVTDIEVASVPGDKQWARRGWRETRRSYVAPVAHVEAWVGPEEPLYDAR
jgi:GNAT superfamily N-acetyltransferase